MACNEVAVAIYKLYIHCQECGYLIQRHIERIQGVQKVEIHCSRGEVRVRGRIDVKEVHEVIEKTSKSKVEIISHSAEFVTIKTETRKVEDRRVVIKVQMHCSKCEYDVKMKILKLKGVRSVSIDSKSQTCTVEGSIRGEKLVEYVWKKMHKHVEIIVAENKQLKKEDKCLKEVEVKKRCCSCCDGAAKRKEECCLKEVEVEECCWVCDRAERWEEACICHGIPCCSRSVYAPQCFSEENPHACCVM